MASLLFDSWTLRQLSFRNRVFVSPMCQYACHEGLATDWHLVHLGSRAVGGAGLVMAEATAVSPEGRISPADLGLWNDAQAAALAPVAAFIRAQGSVPAIQLAHAGRKASTASPWAGGRGLSLADGGWVPLAPGTTPFGPDFPTPKRATVADLRQVIDDFVAAAGRAHRAGFEVVEIHMAHGYLLHEFLSPLANDRHDEYGGRLAHRLRFPLEVATAVRSVWPAERPVFVRVSATDWVEGGLTVDECVVLARHLREAGIDFIDCSSGGVVADAKIPVAPGYQTPFAARIRREADIATGAVGMIGDPWQAEQILQNGLADAVLLAREFLRDPYWPLHAAEKLHASVEWPRPYQRAQHR